MRKRGNRSVAVTEEERRQVMAFLNDETMSYAEFAEKLGKTRGQVIYLVKKVRKEIADETIGRTERRDT